MKIVQLRAENIKRLRAVEIKPDGNLVVISGKNCAGKSSVLDSIWYALGGKEAAKDAPHPIRHGESRAEVSLDLGDLRVTRSWTSDEKTYLKVEAKDGARYSSPQQVLDSLVGRFSFDPLAFIHQDEKAQVKTLLGLLDLGVDLPALDKERADLYAQRTEIGRTVTALEGQLAGMPAADPSLPTEEQSAAAVMDAYTAAVAQQQANEKKLTDLQHAAIDIDDAKTMIADLERRLAGAKTSLEIAETWYAELVGEVANLDDPHPEQFKERLSALEATNAKVREAKKRAGIAQELGAAQVKRNLLSTKIESIDNDKAAALSAAAMPIAGLGFGEDGVTLNGLPLKQASGSEQLRVGLAIAMALNPKLRVIRITDGSLLDADALKLVAEMAEAQDFQCWIERVADGQGIGIHIEDGQVVE